MTDSNILFIVLDTCRRDVFYSNISKYPNLNYIYGKSEFYENAISSAPWTTPSHASMFTGLYPSEHGVIEKFDDADFLNSISSLPKKTNSIAKIAKDNGFYTKSIVSNLGLGTGTAFEEGFHNVENVGAFQRLWRYYQKQRELANIGKKWTDVSKDNVKNQHIRNPLTLSKIALLELQKELSMVRNKYPYSKGAYDAIRNFRNTNLRDRFFIFMNLMEMHEPYSIFDEFPFRVPAHHSFHDIRASYLKANITQQSFALNKHMKELNRIRSYLEGQMSLLDRSIGSILSVLKEKNVYDDTTVIITSDHGQALGEKNFVGHSYYLTDEVINVPLLIKNTESKKSRDHSYLSTTDLYYYINNIIKGLPGKFPHRNFIFSEAFGMVRSEWQSLLGKMSEIYSPESRKRIFDKNGKNLTVNGSTGTVEDFNNFQQQGNHFSTDLKSELLEELEIFSGSQNFKFPEK